MGENEALTVLIVDDEPAAINTINKRLSAHSDQLRVVGEAKTAEEAQTLIDALNPDLMFLDISMPGQDGITFARRFNRNSGPIIVFLTAYDSRALEAFETEAIDYLTKPVAPHHLERAVGKAVDECKRRRRVAFASRVQSLAAQYSQKPQAPTGHSLISLSVGTKMIHVNQAKISVLEAAGDYVCVYTDDETYVVRSSLRSLEQDLTTDRFVQTHRCTIVNVDQVDRFVETGQPHVVMANGKSYPVSRRRVRQVRDLFVAR
ncbi:MAG: LytTR family DNA-binding domain-containing protein [Pseudomonadota bacterium]